MQLVESLYAWPARAAAAILAIIVCQVFMLVLFPSATLKTGSDKNKVTDLQQAHTVKRFREVLLGWCDAGGNPNAVAVMKRENIIKLDIAFPFAYALALAFAYAAARGNAAPGRLDLALFLAPLVAGLFDLVENGLHLYLLNGVNTRAQAEAADFSPALVFAASAFARAKYLLLLVSLVSIVIACFASIYSAASAGLKNNS